ncbi:hydrophobic protein [Streptomyces roseolus]|uniref:hydrophobic protein n=1 Tax=Streptomyces TaxID=1883 RepID=UPI0036ECFA53
MDDRRCGGTTRAGARRGDVRIPLLLVLLLILVLFGAGFAVEVLWYIALAVPVIWVLGYFVRGSQGRRYRW